MTQIKRLPIELLRSLPRENQTDYIAKYHAICTEKYDWYVRESGGGAYYSNGDVPILEGGDEAFDCNWTPEQWHLRPYRYFYNPVQKAIYKSYARYGLPPLSEYHYGWKREDSLILKNGQPYYYGMFRDGDTSAHYFPQTGDIWIMHNGSYTYYYGVSEKHMQGPTFSTVKDVKKPMTEPVMAAAKKLNRAKYNGLYAPFIERLIELYGLNHTQI